MLTLQHRRLYRLGRGRGADRLKDNNFKACRKKTPFFIYEGPQSTFESARQVETQKNRPKQDLMKFLNVAKCVGYQNL